MIAWDDPKRDHGDAPQDFAVIAADVESRGLPKLGSSGNRQMTIRNPGREYLPRTVYVGKRGNPRHHPAGQPWYIEWETPGASPRAQRTPRFCLTDRAAVVSWLQLSGFQPVHVGWSGAQFPN